MATKVEKSALPALLADEPVVACYLFGSWARGQQTDDSDMDLAILLDADAPREESCPGMDVRLETRIRLTLPIKDGRDLVTEGN